MSRTRLFAAAVAVLALGAVASSCQTYEVDPVKPAAASVAKTTSVVAQQLSPNVIIVVDRSGSMADSPDGTQSGLCPQAGQQNQACKWDELLSAMTGNQGFIASLVAKAGASDPVRLGLVTFGGFDPNQSATVQNSCAPGILQFPVTSADSTLVQNINDKLLSVPPNGATPTAASLGVAQQALQAAQQQDSANGVTRKSYVVLLTDGAPNCNANFQATQANCSADRCVSNGACYGQTYAPYGCLDEDNTVATVQSLAQQQNSISTFVIGFGADFNNLQSPTVETLERMAIAGQTRRVDANNQPLEPAFYRATSQQDLTDALNAIIAAIGNKCQYTLAKTPASAASVEVKVTQGGQTTTLNANQYSVAGNSVTITDSGVCTQLSSASQSNPATIEFDFLGQ